MQRLWGTTKESGKDFQLELTRKSSGYDGILNNQVIDLPANSFPTAVWHYAITEHTVLFSIPEFHLLNVKIKKLADSVRIGDVDVEAEKYEFSGDWEAIVWFDKNKQFLKWEYKVQNRTVTVVLDP